MLPLLPTALAVTTLESDRSKDVAFTALTTVASIAAAMATRKLITAGWERTTGEAPPKNPADPTTPWRDAIAWSVATGVTVGVARLVARRGTTDLWTNVVGELPPKLQPAKQSPTTKAA